MCYYELAYMRGCVYESVRLCASVCWNICEGVCMRVLACVQVCLRLCDGVYASKRLCANVCCVYARVCVCECALMCHVAVAFGHR